MELLCDWPNRHLTNRVQDFPFFAHYYSVAYFSNKSQHARARAIDVDQLDTPAFARHESVLCWGATGYNAPLPLQRAPLLHICRVWLVPMLMINITPNKWTMLS